MAKEKQLKNRNLLQDIENILRILGFRGETDDEEGYQDWPPRQLRFAPTRGRDRSTDFLAWFAAPGDAAFLFGG